MIDVETKKQIEEQIRMSTDSAIQTITMFVKQERDERIKASDTILKKIEQLFLLVQPMNDRLGSLEPLRKSFEEREKAIAYLGERGKNIITIAKYLTAISVIFFTAIAIIKIALNK